MTRIAVLGATGSIGTQALEVIRRLRRSGAELEIVALAAGRRVEELCRAASEFSVALVSLRGPEEAQKARKLLPPYVEVFHGQEGLEAIARHPQVDVVLNAVVGAAGLRATLAALSAGKRVALANKESLVIGGHLVMELVRDPDQLIPVDSEHSALWQAMRGVRREEVRKLWITASGGAFRDLPPEDLARVTPQEALSHPTWRMGPRITVDSATLVNKGFEVIEAHWLFGMSYERIGVLLHPQSLVHGLVELVDGNVIAVISEPDMRIPIQYALTYPRHRSPPARRLELAGKTLEFREIPWNKYPAFSVVVQAGKEGGTAPAAINAADEELVTAFLAGRIPFTAIAEGLAYILERHPNVPRPTLEEIEAADMWARTESRRWMRDRFGPTIV